MTTLRKAAAAAAVAAAAIYALAGGPQLADPLAQPALDPGQDTLAVHESDQRPDVTAALAQLAKLEVKGRAPKTGYDRAEFGNGWATVNGCDMRNRVLARDLIDVTYEADSDNCIVTTGKLNDPYTGEDVEFIRGSDTSSEIHLDHIVSLSDAWQKGAQHWAYEHRVTFANDPANLLAVTGAANQAKGDGDTATWLPPNRGFRCQLAAIQVDVKHTYQLWVTPAEHEAMTRILTRCRAPR